MRKSWFTEEQLVKSVGEADKTPLAESFCWCPQRSSTFTGIYELSRKT